ncbi:hypothetical protein RHMOL_Rhmol05G0214200 [Rhododendron molle]|uniref:Uncharacterized protein n=1 Tax=Rhododendron molle TaxID=49168 RepID=A0ACC0NRD2_RHOML|nr:hypothetical protein RHMOL_Rhmol05G0214200 [Rhododendron molle]
MCPKCGNEPESVDYMLFHCKQAVRVWLLSAFRFRPEEMQIEEVWNNLGQKGNKKEKRNNPERERVVLFFWHR